MEGRVRKRGLSEKMVYLYNPLPDISEAELLKEAKLDLIEPSADPIFEFFWKWGGGLERERVHIKPGEYLPVRESEATEALREFEPTGLVAIEDPADHELVAERAKAGLRRAIKHYDERSRPVLQRYRRERGVSEDDLFEMRHDLWPYYRNMAAVKFLKAELEDWLDKEKNAA